MEASPGTLAAILDNMLAPFGALLGPNLALLEPSWSPLGAPGDRGARAVKTSVATTRASALLGPSWGYLGPHPGTLIGHPLGALQGEAS